MALKLRRGTDAERQTITPAEGELIYTTDTKELYVGDGLTQGGNLVSAELNDDTSPSLGGNLDLNGNNIIGTGNININGTITASGTVNLGDGVEDNVIVGGQIASSLIPGADAAYDLGAPTGNWRSVYAEGGSINGALNVGSIITGDILGTDSSKIYNSSTDTLSVSSVVSANITSNLKGSVFADDSDTIIDSIDKVVYANNLVCNQFTTTDLIFDNSLKIEVNTPKMNINGSSSDGVTNISKIIFNSSRGTLESPVNSSTGDVTGAVTFASWYNTTYETVSTIFGGLDALAAGSSPYPGRIAFQVRDQNGTFKTSFLNSFGLFSSQSLQAQGYTNSEKLGLLTTFTGNEALLNGTIIYNSTTKHFEVCADSGFVNVPTYVNSAPSSSKGASGDLKGMIFAASDYVYICYADYTDGLSDIWSRVATTGATW